MSETKTVPTYPTDDMWEAFFLHHHANDDSFCESRFWEGDFGNFAASYAAMLAAAPAPSEAEGELTRLEEWIATRATGEWLSMWENDGWCQTGLIRDGEEHAWIRNAVRYLELRGLLEHHPTDANLVRVRHED
jgi:hypothetical protein